MLVLINEYVSLFLLLGFLPGPAFSCLENKMFHSKQNLLCPCVAAAQRGEGLGRWQWFQFWGWRSREGEMGWITEEQQRMTNSVALTALNSSNFPKAVANPVYANPHLSSFQIFLEPLV